MLAALAVDPQPWRDAPEVGERGNGRVGLPHHRRSMELFAQAVKPLGLVASLTLRKIFTSGLGSPSRSIARRSLGPREDNMRVRPKSERQKQTFEWGRKSFHEETRTLARFRHPSIVRVTRVFEALSTAYMVMDFETGEPLEAWLKGLGRPPTQTELDTSSIARRPGDDARSQFLHRDIAPDNIIVRADGTPVLLEFGAAGRAVAEMSRALTGIVKAGCSPHEQYAIDSRHQGPWSDIYALGATFYRAVAGKQPDEATLRVADDQLAPAAVAAVGIYRSGFLNAIDACLKLRPNERPQSVAQVRPMLLGQETRRIPHTARIAEMGNIEGAIKAGRLGKVMDYRGSGVSSLGWLVWRVRVRTTVC